MSRLSPHVPCPTVLRRALPAFRRLEITATAVDSSPRNANTEEGFADGDHTEGLPARVRGLGGRRGRRILPVRTPTRHERAGRARPDPRRHARSDRRDEVRHRHAHPAGHAAGGHAHDARREARRLLRDLRAAVLSADPAGGQARHDRVGIRGRQVGEQEGAPDPQRAVPDDRVEVEPAGAHQVDQRARGRERELPAAPPSRGSDPALGEPAAGKRSGVWERSARLTADVHRDSRQVHGPGASRDAPPRRERGGRRERRVRRGVVPAVGRQHPGRLRHRGHLVQLLRGQGGRELRRGMGPGLRHLPVSEQPARVDALVPRPRPGHDAAERVRGPSGLLPGPWRPRRGQGGAGQPHRPDRGAARPSPE